MPMLTFLRLKGAVIGGLICSNVELCLVLSQFVLIDFPAIFDNMLDYFPDSKVT